MILTDRYTHNSEKGETNIIISVNELNNFSWHDAEIVSICCENADMIWKINELRILKSDLQKWEKPSFSGGSTEIVFKNYRIKSILQHGFKKYQGERLIEEQQDKPLSDAEIAELIDEIISTLASIDEYILYIDKAEGSTDGAQICVKFDVDTMLEYDNVSIEIVCDELIIEQN